MIFKPPLLKLWSSVSVEVSMSFAALLYLISKNALQISIHRKLSDAVSERNS